MPVSSGLQEVRRLLQHQGAHRVISLYLDLDPERFATAPARASQIRSLVDEASREIEGIPDLGHEDKVALREDLKRIDSFLDSPEAPFKGARSLALFCASRDGLFETVQLSRPVPGRVAIDSVPYVEPLIEALERRRWLVALVSRGTATVLTGSPERLQARERLDGGVHGQHDQGGWSQARYERSVEKDAMDHLRSVAETVNRRFRRWRFDRVALGGPHEVVVRFEELLADEVRDRLAPEKVDVDLSSATEAQVRAAVEDIVLEDDRRAERAALDRLADGLGAGARATAGREATISALNERRVEMLLLSGDFGGSGGRCPACGMLVAGGARRCPADGTEVVPVEHLREAVVQAAVVQDAEVMVITHYPDEAPREGVAALLRF
jgi:peptide chain release factor subunit 1